MSSSESRAASYLGLGSVLAVALCTLWLALVGHLDLYINPRYSVFTVVLAAVAVPASIAGLLVIGRGQAHTHDHAGPDDTHDHAAPDDAHDHAAPDDAHDHAAPDDAHEHAGPDDGHDHRAPGGRVLDHRVPGGRLRRTVRTTLSATAALVTVGVTVAMLVLPPTTLSARTAQQRSVDSPTLSNATGSGAVSLLGGVDVDTSEYGVKDWAALVRQTTDTSALVGERVRLTGFVVPGSDGTFTLTRFVISCCAVDAQPVGLGVVTEGTVPDEGRWVRVTGAIAANPDQSASARLVVRAATVQTIEQPSDPYEY